MSLIDEITSQRTRISVIGLGYVGIPITVAFARKAAVIGYDINQEKVDLYRQGIDVTREVGHDVIAGCSAEFTADERRLRDARFHIIAVPTPINPDKTPDLQPVRMASQIVGRNLARGSIVVYESTVYPGVTEDICVPILERESGLTCGVGFKVGYSPERINPGDQVHRFETIVKVVSGMDGESLDTIARVYELAVEAGVYRAESIRVAEAAKVIENSQRDINIAFMNELSIIFDRMGIDTQAVLKAARTKWNFLPFTPGLVGGHCIGIDPYYLTYKAEEIGYHSQIILSGRRINDDMGRYVATHLVKKLISADIPVQGARVAILGFTFKENCPDTRNTKVHDIVVELAEFGIFPDIVDPVADPDEMRIHYGLSPCPLEQVRDMDAVVLAVAHEEFRQLKKPDIERLFRDSPGRVKVLFDIKALLDKEDYQTTDYRYWRL